MVDRGDGVREREGGGGWGRKLCVGARTHIANLLNAREHAHREPHPRLWPARTCAPRPRHRLEPVRGVRVRRTGSAMPGRAPARRLLGRAPSRAPSRAPGALLSPRTTSSAGHEPRAAPDQKRPAPHHQHGPARRACVSLRARRACAHTVTCSVTRCGPRAAPARPAVSLGTAPARRRCDMSAAAPAAPRYAPSEV